MVSLFQENEPAENSSLQSAVIRENFEALYDKVRTLETRATSPESTSVLVTGGAVYFRKGTEQRLQFLNFSSQSFNITTATGFKTRKSDNGTLYRDQQAFTGPSDFESEGLFLEILLSLRPNGTLVFTEALTAQNNTLSSPFNIFFDDSEIPLALIFLVKTNEGTLQPIPQTSIREARPIITTAYQNNQSAAAIEAQVEDNSNRAIRAETALKLTDSFLVRLPPEPKRIVDKTDTTNTQIEVLSGFGWSGTETGFNQILKFAGGFVDFSFTPSTAARVFDAQIVTSDAYGNAQFWNKGLVAARYDSATAAADPTENVVLQVFHGTPAVDPVDVVPPSIPDGYLPLGLVLYQMDGDGVSIEPLISETTINSTRVDKQFPIVDLVPVPSSPVDKDNNPLVFNEVQIDLSGTGFSQSYVENTLYAPGDPIEFFDDNTRSLRRLIDTGGASFDALTNIATIKVTDSFTGISLLRNPKARSVPEHTPVIEDVRPFAGID